MDIIAATLGIIGGLLIVYKNKNGFLLWIVGNMMWIIIGIELHSWGMIIQFLFFETTAIIGYIKWKKEEDYEKM